MLEALLAGLFVGFLAGYAYRGHQLGNGPDNKGMYRKMASAPAWYV